MRLRIDPAPPFTHCDAAFWQPCFSEGGRRALKQALLADFDVVPAPSDGICDGQAAKAGSVEETGDAVCDRSDDRSGAHVDQQRAREYAELAFAICGARKSTRLKSSH